MIVVMRGLKSETLALTSEVGRGSREQAEGLILWMILLSSLMVVMRNCMKQSTGIHVGKSRGEGVYLSGEMCNEIIAQLPCGVIASVRFGFIDYASVVL